VKNFDENFLNEGFATPLTSSPGGPIGRIGITQERIKAPGR